MPPNLAAADDILCESCGYILRGLSPAGNCPECGRAIEESVGEHRRPSNFEVKPSLLSCVRTGAAVLFRPGRFFGGLATRAMGTRAEWFARCHRFVAASVLSVAVCGLVIIDHTFPTSLYRVGWGRDEPEVFGYLLAPVTVVIYGVIVVASRVAAAVIGAMARERPVRLGPAVMRRLLCFHSVHWVVAALVVAVAVGGWLALLVTPMVAIFYLVVAQVIVWLAGGGIVPRGLGWIPVVLVIVVITLIAGWYFNEFEGPRFEPVGGPPRDWQTYRYILAAGMFVAAGYLLITGSLAIRSIMYANDAIAHAPRGEA